MGNLWEVEGSKVISTRLEGEASGLRPYLDLLLGWLNLKGKVQFTTFNSRQSPDFNLELQNRITLALELLKPFTFQPWAGFGRFWRINSNFWYFRESSKFYIIFLSILTSSNKKTQNYKVVDLIESYNFGIKSIFI